MVWNGRSGVAGSLAAFPTRGGGGETPEATWPVWKALNGVADVDLESAVLLVLGLIVFALVIVPLVLFGVELVIVGCLLAASLFGRIVLGRPWLVEARTVTGLSRPRVLEWKVAGWKRSRTHIRQIASELAAGNDPGSLEPPSLA